MIYSGIVEELQFGTSKLWQTTGKSKENGKVSFHWFKEETGEGCFEHRFAGEQEFEVVAISPGLQAAVSECVQARAGRGRIFLSLKAGDRIPLCSVLPCRDDILLPAGSAGCRGGRRLRQPLAGLANSIVNEVSFPHFTRVGTFFSLCGLYMLFITYS